MSIGNILGLGDDSLTETETFGQRREKIEEKPMSFYKNIEKELEKRLKNREGLGHKGVADFLILIDIYQKLSEKYEELLKLGKNQTKEVNLLNQEIFLFRKNIQDKSRLLTDQSEEIKKLFLQKGYLEGKSEKENYKYNELAEGYKILLDNFKKITKSLEEISQEKKYLEKKYEELKARNKILEFETDNLVKEELDKQKDGILDRYSKLLEKEIKKETQKLQEQISNFELQIKELKAEFSEKSNKLANLKIESRKQSKIILDLTDLLAKKNQEIEDLKQQKKDENKELEDENGKLKDGNKELMEENEKLKQKSYKNHIKEQKKLSEKDKKIEELKRQLEAERQKNIKLQGETYAYKEALNSQQPTIVKNYH